MDRAGRTGLLTTAHFPTTRPAGLRRRSVPAGTVLWRIDSEDPARWTWAGFPEPSYRFDPASGSFRVRYLAATMAGAARERYAATGRYVPADHSRHRLVRLTASRALRVLDLRSEVNLDALGLDDRTSTGREPHVQDRCHQLADAVVRWWDDLDGIFYRSRTTPASSANLAIFETGAFDVTSRALVDCTEELVELILGHGFTVGFLPA